MGLNSSSIATDEKIDVAGWDGQVCHKGVCKTMADGQKVCQVWNDPVNTRCADQCHTEGANTRCNRVQECVDADPTTCLGYCNSFSGYWVVDNYAPDCEDVFVFKDYFMINTTGADHAYPTTAVITETALFDLEAAGAYCHPFTGCTETLFHVDFSSTPNNDDDHPAMNNPLVSFNLPCLDFLNMSNTECIQTQSVPVELDLGNSTMQAYLATMIDPETGNPYGDDYWDGAYSYVQISACIYSYKCAVANTTELVNPDNLVGEKRSLSSSVRALNFPSHREMATLQFHQALPRLALRIAAHAAAAQERRRALIREQQED
jgi:hypothetical protein